METQDVWIMFKWFNDQRVLEDLGAEHIWFCTSMEEEKLIVERMLKDSKLLNLMIIRLDDNKPIGIIILANIDARNASAELRVIIGEVEEWGKGLGEEAIRMLLDHAFNVLNLHRIWLRVAEYNYRAIRLYKKCGFLEEGRSRHDHFHKGDWRDALSMSMLADEFRGR